MTRLFILLTIILTAVSTAVSAHNRVSAEKYVIAGIVLSEEGKPLSGAVVRVTGTTVVAGTNTKGEFRLALSESGTRKVSVAFVGYDTQELKVDVAKQKDKLVVQLLPSGNLLAESVVTGSRTERALKDVPVITRVISRAEIERINPQNMQALLQYTLPGIQFRYNTMSQTATMTYQGMNSKMLVFLIDGERMSGESSDHNIDYERINVDDIERIEVIRGAASTLYDSNAQGGVINIITKKADRPFTGSLTARYAGRNGEKYGLNIGVKQGRLASYTTLGYRHRSTYYVQDARAYVYEKIDSLGGLSERRDSSLMRVPLYGYRIWDASQRLAYTFSDKLSAELKASYYNNQRPVRPGRKFKERYEDVTLSARMKYFVDEDHLLDFSYVYDDYAKRNVYIQADLTNKLYNNRNNTARLNYTAALGAHTLSVGAEFDHEYLKHYMLKDSGSVSTSRYSLYVQEDWKLDERLNIVAGVRADKAEAYAFHFTPKLSVLYRPHSDFAIRANYSHGYRPPTLKERYQEFNMMNIMYILGNAGLKAETSQQLSASIEYNRRKLNLTLSAFHNKYKDYITYAYVRSDALQYINSDDRKTTGVEASARYRLTDDAWLMATYNFVDDYNLLNGYNISTVRPHALTFGASYRQRLGEAATGQIGLNGHWGSRFSSYTYVSTEKSYEKYVYDARTLCSLNLSVQLPKWGMTVGFMIDNLFDHKDKASTATVQLPDTGRHYVVTLNLNLADTFKL